MKANKKPKKTDKKTSKKKTSFKNNEITKSNNENNYNKKSSQENEQRIKEIESEIKKNREEKLKRIEFIHNSRNKELLKLEIKLLRKLYCDLFISLPNTFKQNNLSFENFVYEFGQKIHSLCEYDQSKKNNSYDELFKEVNLLLINKYPISPDLTKFNKIQLKKYFYDLGINDEWSLIQKYQQEIDKNEEKQRLKQIALSMKNYYNELNEQIITKKNLEKNLEEKIKEEKEKKNKIDINKIKLINKQKIQKLKENEKMMNMMDKNQIEQIQENEKLKQYFLQNLEQENDNLNEDNYHLINNKLDNAINLQTKQMQNYNQKFYDIPKKNIINTGYQIPDEQLSSLVDQIIQEKKSKINFDNIIIPKENNIDFQEKKESINKIEGIDYEIEKKVNKILSEQRLIKK